MKEKVFVSMLRIWVERKKETNKQTNKISQERTNIFLRKKKKEKPKENCI